MKKISTIIVSTLFAAQSSFAAAGIQDFAGTYKLQGESDMFTKCQMYLQVEVDGSKFKVNTSRIWHDNNWNTAYRMELDYAGNAGAPVPYTYKVYGSTYASVTKFENGVLSTTAKTFSATSLLNPLVVYSPVTTETGELRLSADGQTLYSHQLYRNPLKPSRGTIGGAYIENHCEFKRTNPKTEPLL